MKASEVFEPYLERWWAQRSEEQRASLIKGAEADECPLDEETHRLLRDTNCPVGAVATQWDMQPDIAWSWSPHVRDFLLAQQRRMQADQRARQEPSARAHNLPTPNMYSR